MTRLIYLFILTLMSTYGAKAQDTTQTKRDMEMQQILGMTKTQYETYREGLNVYEKRIKVVLGDKTLDRNARDAAMEKLVAERREYVKKNLTEKQRKNLEEYYNRNTPASPRAKQQKEQEDRLAKRGIRVVKDSTSKKP